MTELLLDLQTPDDLSFIRIVDGRKVADLIVDLSTVELIPHEVESIQLYQRKTDGYVHATAMCQAAGKQSNDYFRLKTTQAFLEELSGETGIPVSGLVAVSKGGNTRRQGTWIHPDVAVNLAQWCSAKFAVRVFRWVSDG